MSFKAFVRNFYEFSTQDSVAIPQAIMELKELNMNESLCLIYIFTLTEGKRRFVNEADILDEFKTIYFKVKPGLINKHFLRTSNGKIDIFYTLKKAYELERAVTK